MASDEVYIEWINYELINYINYELLIGLTIQSLTMVSVNYRLTLWRTTGEDVRLSGGERVNAPYLTAWVTRPGVAPRRIPTRPLRRSLADN